MRLVASQDQLVTLAGVEIPFAAGEYIITEYSHKYSIDEFANVVRQAGLEPEAVWTDDDALFSVHYLSVP
jgi:uncharacterized SAM-dependent methyltransferase